MAGSFSFSGYIKCTLPRCFFLVGMPCLGVLRSYHWLTTVYTGASPLQTFVVIPHIYTTQRVHINVDFVASLLKLSGIVAYTRHLTLELQAALETDT